MSWDLGQKNNQKFPYKRSDEFGVKCRKEGKREG